jgi:glutamine amidotransferase
MPATIAVVDYHKGNLLSVERGLLQAGCHPVVTDDPDVIRAADGVVLPGVGAFADASAYLLASGEMSAIRDAVREGSPFLGICLGMQLAFDSGDEGCEPGAGAEGLGFIPGTCHRLSSETPDGHRYKVPHVGWNNVDFTSLGATSPLFSDVGDHGWFYFTHSYQCEPSNVADVLATTTYAQPFASAAMAGIVFGTQFHPEKSSAPGLVVLDNFGRIVDVAYHRRALDTTFLAEVGK